VIKLNEGGKFHIAIQLCGGYDGTADHGFSEDGDYIIIRTFTTKAERDEAFANAGKNGL
jgi:hypothetical protein